MSDQTMQALQMRGPGELVLTTLPVPTPGPRDVLIRTLVATICTSDLHDLARNPFGIALPRVLGHEAAGVVFACGAEAPEFAPGTRVAVHPVVPCGGCAECARGFGHLCARMGHLGHDRDGAFAEYFVQRADRVRSLPEQVPATVGALLEPVAVCLQAVARAGAVRGHDVLRCLSDPQLALHEIVTHALPFARWAEGFALARDGHNRALKVALTFPETV
jgi:threonine dehydrogenase-like Zn-dependent dehydrogenase